MKLASTAQQEQHGNHDDKAYGSFLMRLRSRLRKNTADGQVLFTTDVEGMFDLYLDTLPESERQFHNCHCCEDFIERYGHLVTIDENGKTTSAFWHEDDTEDLPYYVMLVNLRQTVEAAKVTGVHLSKETFWGSARTGDWTHLATPARYVYLQGALTAGQKMAELKENFKDVLRALIEFDEKTVNTALEILNTEHLYRTEKVRGGAQWLADRHRDRKTGAGVNLLWRAVASAPTGFMHPRASMLGTLLEDIEKGKSFAEVKRAFDAKMHPLRYQRPQAAPKEGAIDAAEKLFEKLGLARSLERRYARLEEVEGIWWPAAVRETKRFYSIFGHLKAKGQPEWNTLKMPPSTMTWAKFRDTVMPDADKIEFFTPNMHLNFGTLLTALYDDAPPILLWDKPELRNPVSSYIYNGGLTPDKFNLGVGWQEVMTICLRPHAWFGGHYPNQTEGAMLLLKDCKDLTNGKHNCLFPENLRGDLHGARAVIEAASKAATRHGIEYASASGIQLEKMENGRVFNTTRLRVTVGGAVTEYRLDRWD